jgi:hypothetical protein
MAINYLGKVAESTTTGDPKTVTSLLTMPAGTLIICALTARRSGAPPGVTSVTDTKGHVYTKSTIAGSICLAGLAWTRTTVPMTTSDQITVDWNGTLTVSWVSIHAFDNAAGVATDTDANASFDATPTSLLTVPGSDWLTFGTFYFPNGAPTVTPVDSSVSRDTGSNSECFSRNGLVALGTHLIGGTTASSHTHYYSAASFAFQSSGSGNPRGQKTVIGV